MDEFELTWDSFGMAMAAVLLIVGIIVRHRVKKIPPASAQFSVVSAMRNAVEKSSCKRLRWINLPAVFEQMAFIFFAIALADPRLPYESHLPFHKRSPGKEALIEGSAIYFLLDHSGSMSQKVLSRSPFSESMYQPKIALLKLMAHALIAGDPDREISERPSDMLGVIAFGRNAEVLVPLTLDHKAVLHAIDQLQAPQDQDVESAGTVLGYAIYKGVSLIEATRHYTEQMLAKGEQPYTLRGAVMILITDGFQDPNRLDREKELRSIPPLQAANYAKDLGIRLYIINIDPNLSSEKFAGERHQMERTAEMTGGKFFLLSERNTIRDLYKQIDELEKSLWYTAPVDAKQPLEKGLQQRWPLYPYFLGAAMLFFGAALTCETMLLRRWP